MTTIKPTLRPVAALGHLPAPAVRVAWTHDGHPRAGDVRAALSALRVDLSGVAIHVDGGAAEVHGNVSDEADRMAIVQTLGHLPGIIVVVDRLRARRPRRSTSGV